MSDHEISPRVLLYSTFLVDKGYSVYHSIKWISVMLVSDFARKECSVRELQIYSIKRLKGISFAIDITYKCNVNSKLLQWTIIMALCF